jgi:hypothetical protein
VPGSYIHREAEEGGGGRRGGRRRRGRRRERQGRKQGRKQGSNKPQRSPSFKSRTTTTISMYVVVGFSFFI